MSERVAKVPVHSLFVEDQKHRLELDIQSLADSLLQVGQINPITVKKIGDEYRVIAGRRRYAALTYIQEELKPEETIYALVNVKELDELREEMITIDENIMRQQLDDIELDEAIYRRKQIYEELNPETRQHVAGGVSKGKDAGKKKPVAFAKDAAKKLNVSRRSVEKAISRAARASDAVKKARAGGLLQSKVDLLVTLEPKEQDELLPLIKKMDLEDSKALIEKTKKVGAKAALLYLEDEAKEDPALKPLIREADRLSEMLAEALREDRVFRGKSRHDYYKRMEELRRRLDKFLDIQGVKLGYVKAIVQRSGGRKIVREARA